MSTFEDDIRRAMAGHDDEAPRAAELLRSLGQATPPRRRRAGWYVPFAVAVAVAAVVLGSVSVGRLLADHQSKPVRVSSGTGQAARLSCPARYAKQAPWVPAKPAGVDGRSRLVPLQTPRSALICAYAGSNTAKRKAGWTRSGRRSLSGGLAGLAQQLSWQPRQIPGDQIVCTLVGGAQTNYLVGLTYPGGATMWVAATDEPNECAAASNGEFTTSGIIGPVVTRAFTSGRWPARPRVSCTGKAFQEIGRLGEEAAMVPAGSTSLTICAPKAHRTITSGYQALARALDRLPTRRSTFACSGSSGPGSYYRLLFSYREGPPVAVDISVGCHPAIDNLALQAASASSVMPIVRQLLTAK